MDPCPPHPQCPVNPSFGPCHCPCQSTGAAVRDDGMTTDEAPKAKAGAGRSAVIGDTHNKIEHKQ